MSGAVIFPRGGWWTLNRTLRTRQFKPLFAGLHNFRGWQPNCNLCGNHRKKLLLQAATSCYMLLCNSREYNPKEKTLWMSIAICCCDTSPSLLKKSRSDKEIEDIPGKNVAKPRVLGDISNSKQLPNNSSVFTWNEGGKVTLKLLKLWGYSQGEPPLICSGAKAASTIPVAEIFVRTLGRYLARKAKYN